MLTPSAFVPTKEDETVPTWIECLTPILQEKVGGLISGHDKASIRGPVICVLNRTFRLRDNWALWFAAWTARRL